MNATDEVSLRQLGIFWQRRKIVTCFSKAFSLTLGRALPGETEVLEVV